MEEKSALVVTPKRWPNDLHMAVGPDPERVDIPSVVIPLYIDRISLRLLDLQLSPLILQAKRINPNKFELNGIDLGLSSPSPLIITCTNLTLRQVNCRVYYTINVIM